MTNAAAAVWSSRFDVRRPLRGPVVWIGALSFEDRCIGSLNLLKDAGIRLEAVIPLEYSTVVWPKADDDELRQRNRDHVARLYPTSIADNEVNRYIDSYSFQDIQETLNAALDRWRPAVVVLDITCLTKIHVLAAAAMLRRCLPTTRWIIAYTIPENYGNLGMPSKDFGWRDVIVAPLSNRGRLENEARGRGIVVAGHEADRLVVGLAELEPSGGLVIVADNSKRPDLSYCSTRNHRKVIRQLTNMHTSDWSTDTVQLQDIAGIELVVNREIMLAMEYQAPIVLFPYGPKSIVFTLALLLSRRCEDLAWFVYPLPSGYRVDHSEGIDETWWCEPLR